jgi:RHH-type transcriptional regulator, proline utilization regulon repressor / proline dehydrogenase / delta 1-pyrroline-5-carboxylate dehydrogenase
MHEAGVPPSPALVPGDGPSARGWSPIEKVAGVAFTGSTETAWRINRALAAKDGPIVPLIAETGGINAMIVDATRCRSRSPTMSCLGLPLGRPALLGLRLLFVQEDIAEPMTDMIIGAAKELALGDPRDPATDIGPVIDAEARDSLQGHITGMRRPQIRYAGRTPDGPLAGGSWMRAAHHRTRFGRALDRGGVRPGPACRDLERRTTSKA